MNKILQKNLNKVTKDTALVIQKNWKTGAETAVAEVYLDKSLSLEQKISQAFMLTNSINDAWWNNKEVSAMFTSSGCRSTSVGDYVLVGDTKYLCADFGWEKLPK